MTEQQTRRKRNPRGQGERLRTDIIGSASRLLADPTSPPLTLRAVAREVGVAATSVYLHFDDIDSLVFAVADRHFGDLLRMQEEAREKADTPYDQVLAMSMAYCEFGLANPGLYQVMFANPLPLPGPATADQMPGRAAFQARCDAVAAYQRGEPSSPEAFRITLLIWQQLHGTVSLRISRPQFPWPPLEAMVTDAVNRLLAVTPR